MGIGDVAHARIMVKANGDRNLRHDGVFVHLLFKRAGKFKMKAKISDSTLHGHARAWDDFVRLPAVLSKAASEWRSHGVTLNALRFTLWDQSKSSIEFFVEAKIFKSYQQKTTWRSSRKSLNEKTECVTSYKCTFHRAYRRHNKNPLEHPSMSTKKNRSLGQQLHAFETLQQTEGELPCLVLQDAVSGGFCCGVNP